MITKKNTRGEHVIVLIYQLSMNDGRRRRRRGDITRFHKESKRERNVKDGFEES